jgi:hypothetical protein
MEKTMLTQFIRTPNWRWIVTALCFFVLFHLLLFYFLSGSNSFLFKSMFWSRAAIVFSFLACISMYAGYRARELVMIESGIAALLYILMLKLLLPSYLAVPVQLQNTFFIIECAIVGFIFAFGGAGIGYWLKRKYQV